MVLVNDNEDSRKMVENCYKRRKTLVNPIIDWTTEEVWEFIREYSVPYCKLYDEGFERLGCIGCPMGSLKRRNEDLNRWGKYKDAYLKAFKKMLANTEKRDGKMTKSYSGDQYVIDWIDADAVMNWWIR